MVSRAACSRRVNQGVRGALVIPGFPLGTTAVFAKEEVSAVFVSSVQNSEVGQRGLGVLKGKRGGGVAPLINKPVVILSPRPIS